MLRFLDSFDHYATADVLEKWTVADTTIANQSVSAAGGRRGSNGWTSSASSRGIVKAIPAATTIITGFALNMGSAPSSALNILEYREVATVHIALRLNTDLSVSVLRNTTVLGSSAAGVVTASGYCFLELKALINDTTGTYEVRVNGANVLSGTGADTRNAATGIVSSVAILFARSGQVFDDLYIADGTGSANNDFLGDVRIDAYLPNANGNSSQLAGSDGNSVDNYLLVDENPPNDDTDYVQSATAAQKDTYGFPNMSHTPASIYGVQVNMSAKKDDAGARSICSVTRSGGSDTDGTTLALSTSYLFYMQVIETDPNTAAAWTQSGWNAAEFGVKVAA